MENLNFSNKYLRLFLETTDLEEAEKVLQKEVLSGIILIPGAMADEYITKVKKMAELCQKHNQEIPISIDILETDPEKMLRQAKDVVYRVNYSNLIIKIPVGWQEVRIIKELSKDNIKVECAAGMNESQAILAANAGARYFSIPVSRIKDLGADPFKMIQNAKQLLEGSGTEIIVSGIRSKNIKDVVDAFLAGAQIVSAPLDVLEKMSVHPKTTENIHIFINAFRQWGQ